MELVKDKDYNDDGNHAIINGKRYAVRFIGQDANTYKHLPGCLAAGSKSGSYNPNPPCCQCGALKRTALIFGVYVPPDDAEAIQQ